MSFDDPFADPPEQRRLLRDLPTLLWLFLPTVAGALVGAVRLNHRRHR